MRIIFLFFLSVILLFPYLLCSFDSFTEYKLNLEKKYENVNNISTWLKNLKNLDKSYLTKHEIEKLNKKIETFPESTINIFDNYTESSVKDKIFACFNYLFRKDKYFYSTGFKIKKEEIKNFEKKLNIKGIKSIVTKRIFAVTLNHPYLKVVPTNQKIVKFNLNEYFDRNIETVLHINELVRILNISRDRKWYFIASKYCFGWLKASDISIIKELDKFKKFNKSFVVITKNFNNFKLGDILPYYKGNIYIPYKQNYKQIKIPAEYIYKGFLPLTKRNVLKLIFNILKTDYKWGGSKNKWDCSLFIMDIFRCFGLILPRNSKKQSEVFCSFNIDGIKDKNSFIVAHGLPCFSLIYAPGHIMLYIGSIKDKAYIAHDFTMLDYKRGEILITDLDFGRLNFETKLKKLVIIPNQP